MGRRSYRPEEIINKLREAEVLLSQDRQLNPSNRPRTGARWKLQTPRDNFTVEQGFATSLLFKW